MGRLMALAAPWMGRLMALTVSGMSRLMARMASWVGLQVAPRVRVRGSVHSPQGVRDENEGDELYEPSIAEGPQNTDGSPPEMDPKKLEEHIHEIAEPWKVKHVTMVEPVESRSTAHVIPALDKIMTRMRYLGITVRRLHSDRAKELLARKLEAWVAHQNLFQTFTCADDPAANGHCESEVLQLKRRTRLLLKSQGQPSTSWPAAVRHATEERMRSQLSDLGTPVPGMITYNKHVLVKRKR